MRRAAIAIVYLAGLAQGFALVVVPAASDLLTASRGYGFSGVQYGSLFVPMVAGAVAASAAGGLLVLRWGLKRLFLTGVLLDVAAMGLVALSAVFMGRPIPSYVTLLAAMLGLGGGFGASLTALNSLAPGFFPAHAESALTALHTLLGTGTALAPVLVSTAIGPAWWWIPALVAFVLLGLALAGSTLPLGSALPAEPAAGRPFEFLRAVSGRLWAFVGVVVLYGVCETLYGNWAILYLHGERGFSSRLAGLGLSAFWGMVTLGRLLTAVVTVWVPPQWVYRGLPLLLFLTFLAVPHVSTPVTGIVLFGCAGLGCSAFLPLSVSLAEEQALRLAEMMGGELMAAYMVGYGIASFAVGPLVRAGWTDLGGVYLGASLVAAAMTVLAFSLVRVRRRGESPAT